VFLGLTHVLRSFATYPHRPNYFFPLADVHSYLSAHLLGAHLGDAMVNIGFLTGHVASHALVLWHVAPVAIPLMIAAAVATHVNARLSLRRSAQPGTWLAGTLAVWVFPLGALVFGGLLPVGLLVYWVSNNVWTLVQQHLVTARLDRENHRPRAEPT
jgi:YidC/Oxa1 family membrane protein insertase